MGLFSRNTENKNTPPPSKKIPDHQHDLYHDLHLIEGKQYQLYQVKEEMKKNEQRILAYKASLLVATSDTLFLRTKNESYKYSEGLTSTRISSIQLYKHKIIFDLDKDILPRTLKKEDLRRIADQETDDIKTQYLEEILDVLRIMPLSSLIQCTAAIYRDDLDIIEKNIKVQQQEQDLFLRLQNHMFLANNTGDYCNLCGAPLIKIAQPDLEREDR